MQRLIVLSAVAMLAICGCDTNQPSNNASSSAAHEHDHDHDHGSHDDHDHGHDHGSHDDHDHGHAEEGPHHGTLVELGKEEFHAEVVHTKDSVTVYILDSQAKQSVAIEVAELTINVLHDGKPEQFKLTASPESGEPAGKSSKFTLVDADLAAHIDDSAAAPKLAVTIDGKSYRGNIHHEHAH